MTAASVRIRGGRRVSAGVLIASVLLLTAAGGCGDLSREELNRGVESLGALAAQGELIADGVARDATKATYTRVMAETLGGEAEHEAEKLADAEPSPEVRAERDEAVGIAVKLSDLFGELRVFPGEESRGLQVRRQMRKTKEDADALVVRLIGEAP
jgi:hypothetical protein